MCKGGGCVSGGDVCKGGVKEGVCKGGGGVSGSVCVRGRVCVRGEGCKGGGCV